MKSYACKTRRDLLRRFESRPTVIAAAITSRGTKAKLPTHIKLYASDSGLSKDSVVLLEQIRTIDKTRLKEKMGTLSPYDMYKVDEALSISFGLGAQDIHKQAT